MGEDEDETIVNLDLFQEEEAKIKKLLEDDDEEMGHSKPKSKPKKSGPDQPKLF